MDTREKIITAARAQQIAQSLRERGVPFKVVTGYFDVLQPALIWDLQQLAEPGALVFAVVLDPPRPLLSTAARQELAAALRVIDYVVQTDPGYKDLFPTLQPSQAIDHQQAHLESAERLIQYVFERHGRSLQWRSGN